MTGWLGWLTDQEIAGDDDDSPDEDISKCRFGRRRVPNAYEYCHWQLRHRPTQHSNSKTANVVLIRIMMNDVTLCYNPAVPDAYI
jgi:hypothetical protein